MTLEGALVTADGRVTVMEGDAEGGEAIVAQGAGEAVLHLQKSTTPSEEDGMGEKSEDRPVGQ